MQLYKDVQNHVLIKNIFAYIVKTSIHGELEERFKLFLYLKNLAYRLIDLDLARPEMSEEEK